jgi:CRP/FNR family transcriptional regulator, cyclic AMP receptor protein
MTEPTLSASGFIRRSPWAAGLSEREFDQVVALSRHRTYEKGNIIVSAGSQPEGWIGLIDGFAVQSVTRMDGHVTRLSAVSEGSWFGEGTLLKVENWRYDAVALRRTHVVIVPTEVFQQLRQTNIPFNQFLQMLLNERLGTFIGLAVSSRMGTVEDRVAGVLRRLFNPNLFGQRNGVVRITQAELGMLAGISRQRANEALKNLGAQGVISVQRDAITVLNMDGLRDNY